MDTEELEAVNNLTESIDRLAERVDSLTDLGKRVDLLAYVMDECLDQIKWLCNNIDRLRPEPQVVHIDRLPGVGEPDRSIHFEYSPNDRRDIVVPESEEEFVEKIEDAILDMEKPDWWNVIQKKISKQWKYLVGINVRTKKPHFGQGIVSAQKFPKGNAAFDFLREHKAVLGKAEVSMVTREMFENAVEEMRA